MPKEFYTERDIEDLFKRGVMSLAITENVVLTELAYEKANRLGLQLIRSQPDNPPCAPVRPYLAQNAPAPVFVSPVSTQAKPVTPDLNARIKEAVLARMGNQVDAAMLDIIIERVLKSTGAR